MSMPVLIALETNGIGYLGFLSEFPGAFVRGKTINEALSKVEHEVKMFRHRGYGKRIMDYVVDYVRKNGGKRIGIGIINENSILKQWYENYGFREIELKKFAHLPFTVCLMSKEV